MTSRSNIPPQHTRPGLRSRRSQGSPSSQSPRTAAASPVASQNQQSNAHSNNQNTDLHTSSSQGAQPTRPPQAQISEQHTAAFAAATAQNDLRRRSERLLARSTAVPEQVEIPDLEASADRSQPDPESDVQNATNQIFADIRTAFFKTPKLNYDELIKWGLRRLGADIATRSVAPLIQVGQNYLRNNAAADGDPLTSGAEFALIAAALGTAVVGHRVSHQLGLMIYEIQQKRATDRAVEASREYREDPAIDRAIGCALQECKNAYALMLSGRQDIRDGLLSAAASNIVGAIAGNSVTTWAVAGVGALVYSTAAVLLLAPPGSARSSWAKYLTRQGKKQIGEAEEEQKAIVKNLRHLRRNRISPADFREKLLSRENEQRRQRATTETTLAVSNLIFALAVQLIAAKLATKYDGEPYGDSSYRAIAGFSGSIGATLGLTIAVRGYWKIADAEKRLNYLQSDQQAET